MTQLLAQKIRASLKSGKLTQNEFARSLSISSNTVSRWVQGYNFPTNAHLEIMRGIFGWSKDEVSELIEDWYGNRSSAQSYRIAGPSYVARAYSGDYLRFLEDLLTLDRQTLPSSDSIWIGNAQSWAPIFEACPFTWRLLLRDGVICGYWHFICPTKSTYNSIQKGELVDADIDLSMLEMPISPGRYYVYFSMLTLSTIDRNPSALSRLMRSLSKAMQEFSDNGIMFDKILAVAETSSGAKLCEHFGMHQAGMTHNTGKIFVRNQNIPSELKKLSSPINPL